MTLRSALLPALVAFGVSAAAAAARHGGPAPQAQAPAVPPQDGASS